MKKQGGRETYEMSEDYDLYWWIVSRAEAEYFAHIEGITHIYPPVGQSDIILVNESINLGRVPF